MAITKEVLDDLLSFCG